MRVRRLVLAILLLLALVPPVPVRAQGEPSREVDLQLVLAVDASGSVNQTRFELQRAGYAAAFRHPDVVAAIRSGMLGTIGVTMLQWTGPRLQVVVVPWTIVDSREAAERFARAVEGAPRQLFGGGTSVSGAIDFSATLFPRSPFTGGRKVIDVSGDGRNTSGRPPSLARDEAVAKGIVINGLPILAVESDLAEHYEEEVIGGPGSFLVPARDFDAFADAVRRKLIQEIAARPAAPDQASSTLSARASTDIGGAMPSALAAPRLTTSSKLAGCSMGRSCGREPDSTR